MKNTKTIWWLVLLAVMAGFLGGVIGADDAKAASKPCNPAQSYSIKQQQKIVDDRQRTADQKQTEHNKAQRDANTANAKVNKLEAAKVQSGKRLAEYVKLAAANSVKSPSISRGYQAKAKAEQETYKSLEAQHLSAVKSAEAASQRANRTLDGVEQSQRNLRNEQTKLANQRSRCS
jgi:hypothetical protein